MAKFSSKTMAERGPQKKQTESLLRWYDINARDLPWRVQGRRQDTYKIWLSEIMLQQTTVAAVREYFVKFITKWPTVHDLAAADREDVMRAWAGLGYYARARNLHACAMIVAENFGGTFPQSFEGLLKLPGIGPYTAGAIAAIAFDQKVVAVDGNVERVISRLHAIEMPLPHSKPAIKAITQSLLPETRCGDFAQALMDLGATICTPKSPNCLICPWTAHCDGRKQGISNSLPRKAPKKAIPVRKGYAFWVEHKGRVLLHQRPDKGLLGGMMAVPTSEWGTRLPHPISGPIAAEWKALAGTVQHTFTHFHLELTVLVAQSGSDGEIRQDGNYRFVKVSDLASEALPTVMRKVVAEVIG
jgi:A/G-specific adenine glycosylase